MDQGKGSLDIDADDADVRISNAHFDKVSADVDDGDLSLETTLADHGEYRIDGQDGLVAFTVTGGGGEFNVRHDDAHVSIQGNFQRVEESENHSKLVLASGNANVNIRVDDGRVRLIRQ
jgi:Putative adhesin